MKEEVASRIDIRLFKNVRVPSYTSILRTQWAIECNQLHTSIPRLCGMSMGTVIRQYSNRTKIVVINTDFSLDNGKGITDTYNVD
jgi:hypothetical protein